MPYRNFSLWPTILISFHKIILRCLVNIKFEKGNVKTKQWILAKKKCTMFNLCFSAMRWYNLHINNKNEIYIYIFSPLIHSWIKTLETKLFYSVFLLKYVIKSQIFNDSEWICKTLHITWLDFTFLLLILLLKGLYSFGKHI